MKPPRRAPGDDALARQRRGDDGDPARPLAPPLRGRDATREGPLAGGAAARVGGVVVVTGYGEERLGYLAALLSEALPEALWVPPPASGEGERERRLARSHLASGISVVQVAATDGQVRQFKDLADRAGARFLLVQATPPSTCGGAAGPPAAPDGDRLGWPCVFVGAGASLTTQLEVVLAAWDQPGATP